MNRLKIHLLLFLLIFLFGGIFKISAQTDKELVRELIAEEQDAVNALVLYSKETRLAIFNATLYPEALIKMESIQTQTSTAFKGLMKPYPQSTQEMIWDLTRYPNLVDRIVDSGNQSKAKIRTILKNYPEVIQVSAKQAIKDHYPLLVNINQLNQAAESAFESILNEYSPQGREALQQMISLPEILTILTENIRLTILVGDLYRKEPQWLHQKADSLNLVLVRQNAKELEDWKTSLENNPDVIEELKASASSYNEYYDYDEDEYQGYVDDIYYDDDNEEPDELIIRHHYNYNYPYWFGYPYWYEYPRWRNYPYWYDWGFYISPQRTIVVIGMPTYHFTHWYFYHPHHHSYWPHLSSHFVKHYYGHREFGGSVTASVNVWRNNNKEVATEQWLKNDENLPKRFKEYGKFETERVKYNQKNPRKTVTQKEYIQKHTRRYPELSKLSKGEIETNDVSDKPNRTLPYKPRTKKPSTNKSKVIIPKSKKTPSKERTVRDKRYIPKVNKAKDYHKNTWEKSKRKKTILPKKPNIKKTVPKSRKKITVPRKKKPQRKSN